MQVLGDTGPRRSRGRSWIANAVCPAGVYAAWLGDRKRAADLVEDGYGARDQR
jgi:hypothetical protein